MWFSAVYDSLYLYKIDYKNYTFLHKKMRQTLKVWGLTEFNCICLHATLGWGGRLRLGSGLWLGRAGLSSSGWWSVTIYWWMNMITTPWSLKHTYRTQLSSKPVDRLQTLVSLQLWLTVNYSYFFSFFEETKRRLKLIEHSTLASQKTARPPLGTWYFVYGVSLTAKVEATSM